MKAIATDLVITSIRSRSDGSLGLSAETPELTAEEKLEFLRLQGIPLNALLEPQDEPVEDTTKVEADLASKSLSQRQRNSLYVLLKYKLGRNPNDEEWRDFYSQFMENNINRIKSQIEELAP